MTSTTWALHRGKMLIGSINGGHTMLDRRLHGLIQMISDGTVFHNIVIDQADLTGIVWGIVHLGGPAQN